MRLGQLARKYNLKQEQIIEFLDNHNPGMGPYHHNTKLSDQIEEQIARHFNRLLGDAELTLEPVESVTPEQQDESLAKEEVEASQESKITSADEDFQETESQIQTELDPSLPAVEEQAKPAATTDTSHKTIETDKLIELLDSEEEEVDLSDITLIKAPKKELEGLKVVGKIDLPEPKSKNVDETEKDQSTGQKPKRQRRPELSPEEKEKRRLRAKKKKEAYEARREKKRLEEEARRLKARKKAHYEKKISKSQVTKTKRTFEAEAAEPEVEITPTPPKTALGRFWAWFWHGK